MSERKEFYVLEIGTSSEDEEASEDWRFFVETREGIETWVSKNRMGGVIRGPVDESRLTKIIGEYYKGLAFAGLAEIGVGWKTPSGETREDIPRENNDIQSNPSPDPIEQEKESSSLRSETSGETGVPQKRKRGRPRRVLEDPSRSRT